MRYPLLALLLLAVLPVLAPGQEFTMVPPKSPAESPAESLQAIKVRPGFKVELMVAEPLVMDPIAFAWGPDGKFWIVEMGDYPLGVDGKNKPGGRIKYLEKSKPDGPYDKMTVFMDNIGYPSGVFPYGKGILVTCAPDIFYAEDTKGTGKADKKEILFTGFKEGNQQHRVNGLTWGIDNWIYGANGDSGGMVKSIKTGKVVDIRGRDFRLKVETGEFEAVSGQSQFGRCRDDWGNWFGNNNSNPMFHYVLDDHYLRRNPHVIYPDVRVPVSVTPGAAQVFPISKPLPRFNTPQGLNHFTSACSTIIYRDTLFGPEFEGNMFVSEPVHNLIHREIVKPKGVTFTSRRADDEQTSEFLASSDNWFRPAMIQVGPDEALWVADMYRYVIEHPEWIPKDWQKKLDLRAGHDLGRIYRVYPADKKPRAMVRMDKMKTEQLVKQLESPNGWTRDMAHQLLLRNRGATDLNELKKVLAPIAKSDSPEARLHALSVLDNFGLVNLQEHSNALKDPHPAVVKYALRIYEDPTKDYFPVADDDRFIRNADPQLRLQYGYCLGVFKAEQSAKLRAKYLLENADDRYLLAAGLSSVSKDNWKSFITDIMKAPKFPAALLAPLVRLAKVHGEPFDVSMLVFRQINTQQDVSLSKQLHAAGDMLEFLGKNDLPFEKLLFNSRVENREKTLQRLNELRTEARKIVANPKAPTSDKILALRLLGRGLGDDRADQKIMLAMLTPRTPDDVQSAVIQNLGWSFDPRLPGLLLAPWKSYSPQLRGQVLDLLLSRPDWTRLTVEALHNKQIPPSEIDAIRRQRLLHHKEEALRLAAAKIFSTPSNSDRGKIADEYWLRLPDKTDKERGAKLFTKSCAACHKLGSVGQQVGPDLASVGDKSPQGLLIAILDPNRAVEARYINYVAVTKAGLTYTGIITGETSTNITLAAPDGKQHQLLRNELDELASTGKSMMPEGLEKDLSPQDLADVIEHVRANQQTPKRKVFPNNQPETVRPDDKGVLRLAPNHAAIFGPKIVIEPQYGNLGWWSSPEDHVIWTVETKEAGVYRVWLDYACADDSAGNTLAIRSGEARLAHKVAGTGSWENYRSVMIGELQLQAGKQEITIRAEGIIRDALIDLKEVKLAPK